MTRQEILQLQARYARLKIAVVGDFCLDRYLDIDPQRREISLETGREVHNVIRVRAQPGGAGTVVNNLVALGVGRIPTIGAVGDDGEGYELRRALKKLAGVECDSLECSDAWRTFTYCKPMLLSDSGPPTELNRLDSKNWSRLPQAVEENILHSIQSLDVDAIVLLDQVDREDTGIATTRVRSAVAEVAARRGIPAIADSRCGLDRFPPMHFKMNASELSRLMKMPADDLDAVGRVAAQLAARNRQPVFVTLSERGILAAEPSGAIHHAPSLPVRGPIDVVGAGDCVTANLIAALASGVPLKDALALAMAAASIAIHQLGTTGAATIEQIAELAV